MLNILMKKENFLETNFLIYQLLSFKKLFQHEYDHLMGIDILHWKINEGNLEVHECNENQNLKEVK